MNTAIPTNGFRIIHPNLKNWPIDCIAANLIKEHFATAETEADLRPACLRLEKLPSTEIVEPRGVLLEHRLTPSPNLDTFAIYEPKEFEDDYFEYPLMYDGVLLGTTSFNIQLNRQKLFAQVFTADGSESTLSDDHTVFLSLLHVVRDESFFLSSIIQMILPKLTIAVARPRNFASYQRADDCYEKMEILLVYVKSDDISTFADEMIRTKLHEAGIEDWEIHEVNLPLQCIVIPLVCRTFCRVGQF